MHAQLWSRKRGTYPNPEQASFSVKFVRVPIWLCDEASISFLDNSCRRVEASSVQWILNGSLNTVEAVIWAINPSAVPPDSTFSAGGIVYVVCIIVRQEEQARRRVS